MKAKLTARPFSDPDWVFERKLDGVRAIVRRDPDGATLTSRTGRRMNGYPELIEALRGRVGAGVRRRRRDRRLRGLADQLREAPGPARDRRAAARAADRDRGLHLRLRPARAGRPRPHRPAAARAQGDPQIEPRIPRPGPLHPAPQREGGEVLPRSLPQRLGGADRQARRLALRALALERLAEAEVLLRAGAGDRRLHPAERLARALRRPAGRLQRRRRPSLRGQSRDRLRPPHAGDARRQDGGAAPGEDARSPRAPALPRDATWIRPELVGEFGFSEWTRDGKLRHPRYLGLRDDKNASEVVRELPNADAPLVARFEWAVCAIRNHAARLVLAGAEAAGLEGAAAQGVPALGGDGDEAAALAGPCAPAAGRAGRCGRSPGACRARPGRGSGRPAGGAARSRRRRGRRSPAGSPRRMGSRGEVTHPPGRVRSGRRWRSSASTNANGTSARPPSRRRAKAARKRKGEAALRRPGTLRHPPALGPAARARRRRRLLGGAQRHPPRPRRKPQSRPHRGPPARVHELRRGDPEGRVRRRDDEGLGPAAPTRRRSGATARSSSASKASACAAATCSSGRAGRRTG